MTIALTFTFGDGVIIATDSATTMAYQNGAVANVYTNAEKCMNLVCGLPVGLATYNRGSFQDRSIIRYARDLRERLSSGSDEWRIDPNSYSMEDLAQKVRRFFFDELHLPTHLAEQVSSGLGLILSGYSSGATKPEVWSIEMQDDSCEEPSCVLPAGTTNVYWRGMGTALTRLVLGFSDELFHEVVASGAPPDQAQAMLERTAPLWHPGMPIQDAIDLVKYLADVVTGYVRFAPGPPSVAPPIDIAAITRHEGFRWVRRKHYFAEALNPAWIHALPSQQEDRA